MCPQGGREAVTRKDVDLPMGQRIFRDTLRVSVASVAAQAVAFAAGAYIAAVFGATWQTDVFYLAFALPLFGANVIREAIKAVLVPVLVEVKVKTPDEVHAVVASALSAVTAIASAVALFFLVSGPWMLPRATTGLTPEGIRLLGQVLLELMPTLPLMCLAGVLSGLLNAYQHFRLPMIVPGVEATVKAVCVLALVRPMGIHSLALGSVLGALASLVLLWGWARRCGLTLNFSARLHPSLVKMGRLALFPLLGNTLLLLNPFVDRTVATRLPPGSITALNYAERINSLPHVLVGAGLFSVVLSYWSQMVSEEGPGRLGGTLQEGVVTLIYVLTPVAGLLFAFRQPLVRLILERGHFDATATSLTALALGYLALGLIPTYVVSLLTRAHLVMQDTRTPVLLGILNAGLNLVLDIALVGALALGGIALSTSLTLTIVAAANLWIIRRRVVAPPWRALVAPVSYALAVGLASTVVARLVYSAWQVTLGSRSLLGLVAGLGVSGSVGLVAFVGGSMLLGMQEPYRMLGWLRRTATIEKGA